ncbi:NusA-like transcription termination signal-binding factor [Candidatus Woesearchaeota archaeon CG10_big_fil_rev_8_21_14_0_10_37_12]|nr:MAG: NusA-like transcription termination signal-binding factor [Candidatus Woesearchaeota archaeon CG10_big_fil_rev_8_21_14_0_10_37_12]
MQEAICNFCYWRDCMKFVLDTNAMQTISLFEKLTRADVKDCVLLPDQVIFVVQEGEIGKAIGKGGQNVRDLERRLKKKIRIVEFKSDLLEFVKKVVAPLELADISLDGDAVILSAKDLKTRGLLIGRGASNLRAFESIVKRYFPIKELKVI